MKQIKRLFLLLCLIVAGVQSANAQYEARGKYEFVKDITVQNVVYSLYNVTAVYAWDGTEYNENLGCKARVKSLAAVTTEDCVIPSKVYDSDIEYTVEGISENYNGTTRYIKSLTFEGPIGIDYYNKKYYISIGFGTLIWSVKSTISEDFGVNFDKLKLTNLERLYINKLNMQGTPETWKFERTSRHFESLTDVYFLKDCPTLSSGMFVDANYITIHLQPQYIKESMQYSAVWCDFNAIVPYCSSYTATVTNSSTNEVKVYSLGKQNYSEDALSLESTVAATNSSSVTFNAGENYYLKLYYDVTTQNRPTLTRNGVEVTLTDVSAGVVGYQETNVQGEINYVVTSSNKHCRLSFAGSGAVAGNYQITRDGQTYTGKITNSNPGFVDCDYGTTATLTMPATPYLLKNSLKQIIYGSTITTQNITRPSPVNGVYTINITIPSVSATRFEYAYDIPTAVVNEDPKITLIRMGEGEVTFKKFWEWDDQDERWRNEETLNCIQTTTRTTIPYPSSLSPNGWGFTLTVKPLNGQVLREFMIGCITGADNGEGRDFIYWETPNAIYNETTNTYTFTVDLENNINDMMFGMQDLDILVDMGPLETIVEDGYKQSIVCKGGSESTAVWYAAESVLNLPSNGAASFILDDDTQFDHFLEVRPVKGEKFTAYRDGVDVTNEFYGPSSSGVYMYEFGSKSYFYASGWTILFEKDENVITGYDWKVIGQNVPEGSKLTIVYEDEEDEHVLTDSANDIHINASGLQSARFEIPASEGFNLILSRDGEEMGSAMTLADGIYTLTIPALEILDATWFVGMQAETDKLAWTVVKTAVVEDAEVRMSVEGGEEETITLSDACTEIGVTGATSAQLRVKGSVTSSTYDLYLNAFDGSVKLEVIKAVKAATGLGLLESKAIVESTLPVKVKGFETRALAEAAQDTLLAVPGTQCSIKNPGVGTFVKVLRNGVNVTDDMTPDGDYLMMTIDAADLTRTTWVITTEELINRFDVNEDGQISIADVTKLVNKILGKE